MFKCSCNAALDALGASKTLRRSLETFHFSPWQSCVLQGFGIVGSIRVLHANYHLLLVQDRGMDPSSSPYTIPRNMLVCIFLCIVSFPTTINRTASWEVCIGVLNSSRHVLINGPLPSYHSPDVRPN